MSVARLFFNKGKFLRTWQEYAVTCRGVRYGQTRAVWSPECGATVLSDLPFDVWLPYCCRSTV